MPQRNGQNPTRAIGNFGHLDKKTADTPESLTKTSAAIAGLCPACKTPVPAKPGFRVSSLKCPKCGASLGKK